MALSGYRIMWLFVMFDLPVVSKAERSTATRFRKFLLDQGFEMSQYSIYLRFCSGKEQIETYVRRVREHLPSTGKVHLLSITDRQYEAIVSFDGRKRQPGWKTPSQLALF